jgi:hypothetical protein
LAVDRVKGLVVAEGAAAKANRPVSVGTGKAGIDGNLLYLCAELFLQPRAVFYVFHVSKLHKKSEMHFLACVFLEKRCNFGVKNT